MKAQGGSLKVAVYLFCGLFILLMITTSWLLGDNAFLHPREVTMNALLPVVTSPLPTKLRSTN